MLSLISLHNSSSDILSSKEMIFSLLFAFLIIINELLTKRYYLRYSMNIYNMINSLQVQAKNQSEIINQVLPTHVSRIFYKKANCCFRSLRGSSQQESQDPLMSEPAQRKSIKMSQCYSAKFTAFTPSQIMLPREKCLNCSIFFSQNLKSRSKSSIYIRSDEMSTVTIISYSSIPLRSSTV